MRAWIARNVASVMFLAFYFITVVAANLLYATPLAKPLLTASGMPQEFLNFPTTFSVGYWALLMMPFVAVPLLVPPLRRVLSRWIVGPVVGYVPDFRPADYAVIFAIVVGIVMYALWRTEAFALVGNATSAKEAIDARFVLQARMSFLVEKIAIHSLLPFMSLYAITAAIKSGGRFWTVFAVLSVGVALVALVAINMKWPVLIFYIGAVASIFLFTQRWAYTKAILGSIGLVAFYLIISTYVFRWVPHIAPPNQVAGQHQQAAEQASGEALSKPEEVVNKPNLEYTALAEHSVEQSPLLFAHALNRMAIAYPYYYKVFTEEGPICGTLMETYLPGAKPCAPTFLIYSRIFIGDGYDGRGSSPAAPHVTAYAQQGWIGALVGMLGTCVLLAGFSAIPLSSGPMAGAWTVVGATVGYHLSQIPIEGPIIYDHGILWPLLLVAAYTGYYYAIKKLSGGA